jgi:hypothetical protein
MKKVEFSSFKGASYLALSLSEHFEVCIEIKRHEDKYIVCIPSPLHVPDLRKFTSNVYFLGAIDEDLLSLLDYADTSRFSSSSLAWRDPDTGLAWDVARLCCSDGRTDFPQVGAVVMNALQYAGLRNWRLPTLDELRTLSPDKLNAAGIDYKKSTKGAIHFWSCEESLYSGPEKSFLDLSSMRVGHQRFIEQDRNWSSPGDGYTESAQTIMVSSEC